MTPTAYQRTLSKLYGRRRFGLQPGLETIRALLEALGHPELKFPSIHVTGSKGKGSVAAMAQAILTAGGWRTGLFTSPHLTRYVERIRIDGTPIDRADLVRVIGRVERAAGRLAEAGTIDREPTFFEVTTAAALDYFARARVDAAVVEVGIGGRLDATNILDSRVGVVTTMEIEHTDLLGPTLAHIAREKAGIFHPGMTGVIGDLPEEARKIVRSVAREQGVPLWELGHEIGFEDRRLSPQGQQFTVRLPGKRFDGIRISLNGSFQPGNTALAVAAVARFLSAQDASLPKTWVRSGLRSLRWPGRLERIARSPDLYVDVAHTPESARAVAHSLAEISPLADPEANVLVFGCLRGKDVDRILDALAPLARRIVLAPVRSERSLAPVELKVVAHAHFPAVILARSATEALALARAGTGPDGFTLVTGSDYLVGELLRPSDAEADLEPDLSDPGVGGRPKDPPPAPLRTRRR
ncbi:MAG: bifunctional folylpolyglutamate synthase/dihydrofolate synthase [Thermoplasmata archaeon]